MFNGLGRWMAGAEDFDRPTDEEQAQNDAYYQLLLLRQSVHEGNLIARLAINKHAMRLYSG